MYKSISMLLVGLYAQSSMAAPTISSIENADVESGPKMTVVVNGSGFGQGPDVKFFEDFSGFKAGDVYTKSDLPEGFDADLPPGDLLIDEYRGKKGFKAYNYEEGRTSILRTKLGELQTDAFVAYSVAVPEGHTLPAATEPGEIGGGWKMAWLWEHGPRGADHDSKFDLVIPTMVSNNNSVSGNSARFVSHETGRAYIPPMQTDTWWTWNEYNHIGVWFDGDLEEPVNSTVYFSVVTEKAQYLSDYYADSAYFDPERSDAPQFDRVNFPGWLRKRDDDNFQAIYTNLYVATGENHKARIEVTNSASYENSTFRKVLKADSWVENQIELRITKSDLRVAGNLFVHVFDRYGQRVEKGELLCVVCPVIEGN